VSRLWQSGTGRISRDDAQWRADRSLPGRAGLRYTTGSASPVNFLGIEHVQIFFRAASGVFFLSMALVACGGPSPAPTSTILPPMPAPISTTRPPTPAPTGTIPPPVRATPVPVTPLAARPFTVTFKRSGGIAGIIQTHVIRADGLVDTPSGDRQLSAQAIADLEARLEATGLYGVPSGAYLPPNPCCDRFTYELTIEKDGARYDYVTTDGTSGAPPALAQAIDMVSAVLAGVR
jgi:hypothetical protein